MTSTVLRLGTRRSALARAQSGLVARALEARHRGLRVALIGIDTRGDLILDQPLSTVDGKEFFTAELDRALLGGAVDFTVHSFKDLALERPSGLLLAAVPMRENPRDIVLFAPDVMARLAAGAALRIGSSSPRRAAFVPGFLRRALPGGNARVELCELRGNVDSRLRRLHEPRGSARQLDGVVLAFAGLARLWQDPLAGRALLTELLAGLPRMLLPLTAVPGAPAQAALAIECRADDAPTVALLRALDDSATRSAVTAERQLLAARGGGCHQRFGATQVSVPGLGQLLYTRDAAADTGEAPQRARLEWRSSTPLPVPGVVRAAWDGSQQAALATEAVPGAAADCALALQRTRACYIAHRRALPDFGAELAAAAFGAARHVWVPGTESWFALAQRGVWVEGCAEGLGFETLRSTLAEPVLTLPALDQWLALTHAEAVAGWQAMGIEVLATYRHSLVGDAALAANDSASPAKASHIYWHSAAQFARWRGSAATTAHHACAFGKSAEQLRAAGISRLTVFPSVTQWRAWLAE
jgi:hydroxymethylbilane synthase